MTPQPMRWRAGGWALGAALLASCGSGADRSGGNFVSIYDNNFSAAIIRIPQGGLLRWMHVGHVVHNVVPIDGDWATSAGRGRTSSPAARSRPAFPPPESIATTAATTAPPMARA